MSAGICCDPLGVGCTRPTQAGIALKNTPHNRSMPQPCQRCRIRRAKKEREAVGRPRWRAGAGQMERL